MMSLEQIKKDWDKHKSIELNHAIENYSIYHCVNYICDTFLQENACLLSDVVTVYEMINTSLAPKTTLKLGNESIGL